MSNNKISYLNRTFDDYREALVDYVRRYYPKIADDFNDSGKIYVYIYNDSQLQLGTDGFVKANQVLDASLKEQIELNIPNDTKAVRWTNALEFSKFYSGKSESEIIPMTEKHYNMNWIKEDVNMIVLSGT